VLHICLFPAIKTNLATKLREPKGLKELQEEACFLQAPQVEERLTDFFRPQDIGSPDPKPQLLLITPKCLKRD